MTPEKKSGIAIGREVAAYRALTLVVAAIVDDPGQVNIEVVHETHETRFLVHADQRDAAFLIGKKGRNVRSLRIVMSAIARAAKSKYSVDIVDRDAADRAATGCPLP